MSSAWIRPRAEEEQFDSLSRAFDLPKESICACPRGLRRFIKKFILSSTNSNGKMEDHLVVLFNDALVVAERAGRRRTETHEFDIQYTIPLLGLIVSSHPGVILLEHNQEGMHVILEGNEPVIKTAYESIREEAESVNDVVDHLPTSVVRPSRDPRSRGMSQSCGSSSSDVALVRPMPRHDVEDDEEILTVDDDEETRREMQRAAAAAEAKLRRRQARKSRDVRHQEIVEVVDDNDDEEEDDEEEDDGVQYVTMDVATAEKLKARHEKEMIDSIFGANSSVVRGKHQVQFAEDVSMMDDDWDPKIYQIIAFLDFFVVQKYPITVRRKRKRRQNHRRRIPYDSDSSEPEESDEWEESEMKYRYEAFYLHDCRPSIRPYTNDSSLIELCWPHKTYRLEMDNEDAQDWLEKMETCIMIAQATEDSKTEEERRAVGVIGSCIVHRGRMSYGTRAHEPMRAHRDGDDVANFARVLNIQNSLGPECNWMVAERRKLIQQAPMIMIDSTGQETISRIFLLNDRLLITKAADVPASKFHINEIIANIDVLNANYTHEGDILHIKHKRGRNFLATRNPFGAEHWCDILERTAHERRVYNAWMIRRAEFFLDQQRMIQRRQIAASVERRRLQQLNFFHQTSSALPDHLLPTLADPNLEQENNDEIVCLDDITRESSKSSHIDVDSDGEEDVRAPSRDRNRLNDFEEMENQENQDNDENQENQENDENQENMQLELQFTQMTGQMEQPFNSPRSIKRRAPSPVQHQPRRKHPKLRLSLSNVESRQEITEEMLPILPGGDGPGENHRGVSPASGHSQSFVPTTHSFSDFGGRSATPHFNRGKNPAERERFAMIASAQKRMDIEERIVARKRREGQGSSMECYLSFISPPNDPYNLPSSPVRSSTAKQIFFVNSLFEEKAEPASQSQMVVIEDIEEEGGSFYETSNDDDEVNESDLLIPEEKEMAWKKTEGTSKLMDEEEMEEEDDDSDADRVEEEDLLRGDDGIGEEEGEDEYYEEEDEKEEDDSRQNEYVNGSDDFGLMEEDVETSYLNGGHSYEDSGESEAHSASSTEEDSGLIKLVPEEKENEEKGSVTAL